MGTNYAPLIKDLLLLCCERDSMLPLSELLTLISRYLDDLLYIDNPYF